MFSRVCWCLTLKQKVKHQLLITGKRLFQLLQETNRRRLTGHEQLWFNFVLQWQTSSFKMIIYRVFWLTETQECSCVSFQTCGGKHEPRRAAVSVSTVWTQRRGAGPGPEWSSLLRCCGQCGCWEPGIFLHWPAARSHSATFRPACTPGRDCQHGRNQHEGKLFDFIFIVILWHHSLRRSRHVRFLTQHCDTW